MVTLVNSPAVEEDLRSQHNPARLYEYPDDAENARHGANHAKVKHKIRQQEFMSTLSIRSVYRDVRNGTGDEQQ